MDLFDDVGSCCVRINIVQSCPPGSTSPCGEFHAVSLQLCSSAARQTNARACCRNGRVQLRELGFGGEARSSGLLLVGVFTRIRQACFQQTGSEGRCVASATCRKTCMRDMKPCNKCLTNATQEEARGWRRHTSGDCLVACYSTANADCSTDTDINMQHCSIYT